jgi:ADP-ribosylglycohydrolase
MTHRAYLRWLETQGQTSAHEAFGSATRADENGWLLKVKALHAQRAPGNTCLSALRASRMGTMEQPLNDSKGCGGVMRMAPVGLFFEDPEKAFTTGCEFAAITHGHPSGYLAAGGLAAIISYTMTGVGLRDAVDGTMALLQARSGSEECVAALRRAMAEASRAEPSAQTVEALGAGWVAEEALAIAVYSSLAADGDFRRGVLLAVNHSGDSDSTGAITGNILGALVGKAAVPAHWLDDLELRAEIEALANDLSVRFRDDQDWWARYPGY